MRFLTSMWDGGIRRGALALAAVLLATAAPAETLRVTAANSVGNLVYDVTSFVPPGTISPLNTDGASHGSFSSVVLTPNLTTGTVDVLVADFTKGQIIRYTPALGATAASTTLVWSYNGSGPINPDGLSQDAAGNLYIVSSKPPQIWVLPASSTSSTGFASAPLLIQGTFAGGSGVVQLQETAVAATAGPAWGAGDVLLLVGNKNSTSNQNTNNDDVYLYRAATITRILGGSGPVSAPDQVLISGTQFPNREYGLGMDFWPGDSFDPNPTLLVLTTAGRILRYDFTAHDPSLVQVFASGLGGGLAKLKVGLQLENRYAYVTQTLSGNTGQILQFGAPTSPGTTNLIGSASQGVQSPDGLAVEPLGTATAASCATSSGCDISSGVIPHKLLTTGTQPTGNVIEGHLRRAEGSARQRWGVRRYDAERCDPVPRFRQRDHSGDPVRRLGRVQGRLCAGAHERHGRQRYPGRPHYFRGERRQDIAARHRSVQPVLPIHHVRMGAVLGRQSERRHRRQRRSGDGAGRTRRDDLVLRDLGWGQSRDVRLWRGPGTEHQRVDRRFRRGCAEQVQRSVLDRRRGQHPAGDQDGRKCVPQQRQRLPLAGRLRLRRERSGAMRHAGGPGPESRHQLPG